VWQVALLGSDDNSIYREALGAAGELSVAGGEDRTEAAQWERALADGRVAAAAVAVPLAERAYWIARALDQGKHVLAELPAAPSAREALALARRARDSGRHLIIAGDLAGSPVGEELMQRGASCRIGAPVYVRLGLEVPRVALEGRAEGVLTLYGTGLVRLATQACGRLDAVYARARALCTNRPSEDVVVAQFRFVNGAEGLLEASALGDRAVGSVHLSGTDGTCSLSFQPCPEGGLASACRDLLHVLGGGEPRCGARELAQSALLVEWIQQAARRDAETARSDVILT